VIEMYILTKRTLINVGTLLLSTRIAIINNKRANQITVV